MSLTITQLGLEDNEDFLIIGSGAPDDNVIETVTGTDDYYGPIKSFESQMWVRFTSDETVSGRGFMASWEQVEGEEGLSLILDPWEHDLQYPKHPFFIIIQINRHGRVNEIHTGYGPRLSLHVETLQWWHRKGFQEYRCSIHLAPDMTAMIR